MLTLLIVASFLTVVLTEECGIVGSHRDVRSSLTSQHEKQMQISKISEFPWAARVIGNAECGGIIIGSQWILTAASCCGSTVAGTRVIVGSDKVYTEVDATDVLPVEEIIPDEAYNHKGRMEWDMCLIKLREPLQYSDRVSPICLRSKSQSVFDITRATVIGFGFSTVNGTVSTDLRKTVVQISDYEECRAKYDDDVHMGDKDCFTANGIGFNRGNTGGPVLLSDDSGRWYLIGVIAGESSDTPVNSTELGYFTTVRTYCTWINFTTKGDVSCITEPATLINS